MSRGQVYVRKGCKLWLSSDELGLVFTILRKSTRLHYNETHFCNEHRTLMDNRHFMVCDKSGKVWNESMSVVRFLSSKGGWI